MINTSFNTDMQLMMINLILKMLENKFQDNSSNPVENLGNSSTNLLSENGFSGIIKEVSKKYGVEEDLISSVIKAESNFNANAVSSCGAQGLMQLMPATASSLGVVDSFDPEQNIDGGVRYLRSMLNRYGGDIELALAAYNAGPGAVDHYGGIPPYQETQTYVDRVISYYQNQG